MQRSLVTLFGDDHNKTIRILGEKKIFKELYESKMSVSLNNTDDDEYTAHWEQLKVALDTVLLNVPGSYQPISYEQVRHFFPRFSHTMNSNTVFFCPFQMYSAVYKCVCKHFAEQLHADLCHHVLQVVQRWSTDLLQLSQAEDKIPFLVKTDYFLSQFSNALSSIVPLFTYLVNMVTFELQKSTLMDC